MRVMGGAETWLMQFWRLYRRECRGIGSIVADMRDKVLSGDLSAILNVQEPPEYSAPTAGGGTRARNPQTGETLEWDGSQWRQVQ